MKFQKGHKLNLGKKHSEQTKRKISIAHKGRTSPNKGKKFSDEAKINMSKARKGIKLSDEHKEKISKAMQKFVKTGKHNWWKGGISLAYSTGYKSSRYRKWREKIFKRDNYTCQDCGFHGSKGYITAHHINSWAYFPEQRFDLNNGKTLCENCHSKTDNYKGRAVRKGLACV